MGRVLFFLGNNLKLTILIVSIILCFWGMFYPRPYRLIMWVLILFPLLRVLFLSFKKEKFQFNSIAYDNEVIYLSIVFPVFSLGLRSVFDFEIIDFSSGYMPSIFLIILFIIIYLITVNKNLVLFRKENVWLNFYAVLFISFFSFCIITSVNVLLDKNKLRKSQIVVLSKRISRTKGTYYYIKIDHKNETINNKEIHVSKATYNQVEVGDTLSILIGEGKFDIPWFILNNNFP